MLAPLYNRIVRPALFLASADRAHEIGMGLLERIAGSRLLCWVAGFGARSPKLPMQAFGREFPNPVGLAAGMDKNGTALPVWQSLGFGFVEIGTVTARAQPGNPKPRLFRYPAQRALVNRMGFNNDGADAVAERLARWKSRGRWPKIPVGINLGKSRATPLEDAPADYVYSLRKLREFADYIVVNVSSPNTPGLRSLQESGALERLLLEIQEENESGDPKPILVKLAPDIDFGDLDDLVDAAGRRGVSGFVATNTTIDHAGIPAKAGREGGLSGAPLRERSTAMVRVIAQRSRLPVIGVGGVFDGETAREKFEAGACLVQFYTALVYNGPGAARRIVRELSAPADATAEAGSVAA